MSSKLNLATILTIEKSSSLPDALHYQIQFKGCPLHCIWCYHPELQNPNLEISKDETQCVHCMACVSDCPNAAILNINNQVRLHNQNCLGCMSCIEICPQGALAVYGKKISHTTILNQIIGNSAFQSTSPHQITVTLSGGEILSQGEFVITLLKLLKQHSIATTCQTTGYGDTAAFQQLLSYTDRLHFMLAHYDSQKHFSMTGVSDTIIRKNLRIAIREHGNLLVQIPVIPTLNAALNDAENFAESLKASGVTQIQLLPFQQPPIKKYDALDRIYPLPQISSPTAQLLHDYRAIFIKKGLQCTF